MISPSTSNQIQNAFYRLFENIDEPKYDTKVCQESDDKELCQEPTWAKAHLERMLLKPNISPINSRKGVDKK